MRNSHVDSKEISILQNVVTWAADVEYETCAPFEGGLYWAHYINCPAPKMCFDTNEWAECRDNPMRRPCGGP